MVILAPKSEEETGDPGTYVNRVVILRHKSVEKAVILGHVIKVVILRHILIEKVTFLGH